MSRKHPADGHFYLTVNRLRDFNPCVGGLQSFIDGARDIHGSVSDDQKIPVTLDLLDKVFAYRTVGGFVLDVLVRHGALSEEETWEYWGWGDVDEAARLFMDAIAKLPTNHNGVAA
jgi:hypothetical protein